MDGKIKPLIITMGEPAGVAGEITVGAWQSLHAHPPHAFAVMADIHHFKKLAAGCDVVEITHPSETVDVFERAIPVIHMPLEGDVTAGKPNPKHASAVCESIAKAVKWAQAGDISAMVTNPVHKKVFADAGLDFPGHTEYLAYLCGGVDVPVMMLAADVLRVVPITIHIAIRDVPSVLTTELIITKARITYAALKNQFGISAPRIAISGLNPHAGEGGKMGDEEFRIIIPAIDVLLAEGICVSGPHAADTLFHAAARQHYDVALCMYHDQALIPLKTLDFFGGVNVTLGLPIIRTSPDHGTAFDIAGNGIANPESLIAAIKMAQKMGQPLQEK
jgi:4-hydroxythreonine-4-phosphate dehydrogenase